MSTAELCGDFIQYVEKVRGFSPETVRTYRYVLDCFVLQIGNLELASLSLEEIDEQISQHVDSRKLKPSSANLVRCVLRSFFMYVDRYRGIRLAFDYSMIRQVKAPRPRIKFVGTTELLRMVKSLETYQDRLMMMTMYAGGLRISELVRISIEDLNGDELRVRGKGQKERPVPIGHGLAHELQMFIRNNRLSTGPIFRHQGIKASLPNQAYSASGLRKRWQRQLGPLGLYHKPHDLRHGAATKLLLNGMDIRTLQTFLGHSHIATTMLYTHVTDSHLRQAYEQFSPTKGLDLRNVLDTNG